jgi:hypothetical protein
MPTGRTNGHNNGDTSWLKTVSPSMMEKIAEKSAGYGRRKGDEKEHEVFTRYIRRKQPSHHSPNPGNPGTTKKSAKRKSMSPRAAAVGKRKSPTTATVAKNDWVLWSVDPKTGQKLWLGYDKKTGKDMMTVSKTKPPPPSMVTQSSPRAPLQWRVKPDQRLFKKHK